LTGQLHTRTDFHSAILGSNRTVVVYLPAAYAESRRRSFPILYLHDGQNVFDGDTSFIRGQYWRVRETADALIASEEITPLIVAAVYHAGEKRLDEYTPTHSSKMGGGKAALHGRMMVEELKPFMESQYRVLSHRNYVGIGGSSLGGLASLYAGLNYQDVYGKLAVLSPSVWWDNRAITRVVSDLEVTHRARIWLDIGTAEGSSPKLLVQDMRELRDQLIRKGWRRGTTLKYYEVRGGDHSERAWAERMPQVLKFLYPPRRYASRD
jgi:predicted alpha/beta superfamily hydrolase